MVGFPAEGMANVKTSESASSMYGSDEARVHGQKPERGRIQMGFEKGRSHSTLGLVRTNPD